MELNRKLKLILKNLVDPKFYRQVLFELVQFVRNPSILKRSEDGIFIEYFLPLFIIKFLAALIGAISFAVFELTNIVPELENSLNDTNSWPLWEIIMVTGILVPLVEEGSFRAGLRFNRLNASIMSFSITYLLIGIIFFDSVGMRESITSIEFVLRVLSSIIVGCLVYLLLAQSTLVEYINGFIRSRFNIVFWTLVIWFGLIHLERYENFDWFVHGIFVPLIILPQMIAAIVYSYTRLKFGLVAAMALHGFNNTFPYILFTYVITGQID